MNRSKAFFLRQQPIDTRPLVVSQTVEGSTPARLYAADDALLADRYWRVKLEIAVTAGCLIIRSKEMA